MRRSVFIFVSLIAMATAAGPAEAQFSVSIAGYNVTADRQERLEEKHWLLAGSVELERDDTTVYADEVEFFEDKNLAIARGNVVVSQKTSRIAADSAEFNTKTALGTFHHASGIANIQPPRQSAPSLGVAVPQMSGQDTDVYFFGETVEKQGEKKYRITNGGFSTCVQPTPRWDLTADTVVLNVDHYTFLRQAIFRVKGVPMMYLPVLYYPTNEDGRATGFLIPTYGRSTFRGQTIQVPFFWAINRSHDATVAYNYYSKTGGGVEAEYRYETGGGSNGYIRALRIDDRETTYGEQVLPAGRSYTVNGNANRVLPGNFRARASVDYFTSLFTNQTLRTDLTQAGNNRRYYGANVVGAFRSYSLNGTFDYQEYFNNSTTSQVTGNGPRITLSRNERPITKNSRVYFSATADVGQLIREARTGGEVSDDRSLTRVDFAPQIRYPFTKWQWFTVNTSAAWRETFYSRSLGEVDSSVLTEDNLRRGFGTVGVQTTGPTFVRVWNTPDNGYAERFKHTFEPQIGIQRTTAIENFARIIPIDSSDYQYGDTTSITYGLSNRIYAKRKNGRFSVAQEIVALELQQSYYSDPRQAACDQRYQTSCGTAGPPSNLSPVSANLRVSPTQDFNSTARAEMDNRSKRLKTLSVNANLNVGQSLQTTFGWSRRFFVPDLPGYDDRALLDHYLNVSANLRTRDSRYGLNSSLNFDVRQSSLTQRRVSAYYNAQCCGLAMEYQRYSFAGVSSSVIPADHRFFLSFSLAGLGNFSPFSGGLNNVPR